MESPACNGEFKLTQELIDQLDEKLYCNIKMIHFWNDPLLAKKNGFDNKQIRHSGWIRMNFT